MLINPFTFLIGRSIAQNRGVDSATATRDAFVGSIIRPPMLGVVLVSAIAQGQATATPVLAAEEAIAKPDIQHVSPKFPEPGKLITLLGFNLKAGHHHTQVTFGDSTVGQQVSAISPNAVEVLLPSDAVSMASNGRLKIVATIAGVASNPYELEVGGTGMSKMGPK